MSRIGNVLTAENVSLFIVTLKNNLNSWTVKVRKQRNKSMSDSEIIQMLSEIRDYLTAGNPVWDTDMVEETMNIAISAVEIVEEKVKNGEW